MPDHAKPLKSKEKRPGNRALKAECEPDGSFVFEAHEAWKEFHNSLRHFYEVGELCDVTLKVGQSVLQGRVQRFIFFNKMLSHFFLIGIQTKVPQMDKCSSFIIKMLFSFFDLAFFCFCRLAAG